MKKFVASLLPNFVEGAKPNCMVTFSDVNPIDADYVQNRLSKSQLQDIDNVVSLLRKHSEGMPNALWNLATCYDCGISTPRNVDQAKTYYMLAHFQSLLDNGRVRFPKNEMATVLLEDGAQAFEDAAHLGYCCAMYFYGLAFLNGIGVPEDEEKASDWFKRASDAGLDEATNALANSYFHGYGVYPNQEKAIDLWGLSARHGNANACFSLGVVFYNAGQTQRGLNFLSEAANKGYKPAIDALKQLGYRKQNSMTKYMNLQNDSSVLAYGIGEDYIDVLFRGNRLYRYSYSSAGIGKVEQMKALARRGYGLESYINRNAKYDYEYKR